MNHDDNTGEMQPVNCFACEHFYITYEQRFPYGCRVIGFKSARMPSVDVFINSHTPCGLFLQKEKRRHDD